MKVLTKEEIGERIRLVRKFAAGMSGPELAEAIGSKDPATAHKMEKKGQGISLEKLVQISNACARRGMLKKTPPEEILSFLEGRIDELPVVLDGSFSQMSYFGPEPFGGRVVVLPRRNDQLDIDRDLIPSDEVAA